MNDTTNKFKSWLFTNLTNKILWGVYISLLMVLYPHTMWAFSVFEPSTMWGKITSGGAAFAFEAIVAVLVHKLAEYWEAVNKKKFKANSEQHLWWLKFSHKYINAYVFGLLFALVVSVAANTAHAVQYGDEINLRIVHEWGVPFWLYTVVFGAMLPFCSILFAQVLSNANDLDNLFSDSVQNYEEIANQLRTQLTAVQNKFTALKAKHEQELQQYQERVNQVNESVNNDKQRVTEMETTIKQLRTQLLQMGDYSKLTSDDVSTRIKAAKQLWPELSNRSLATVCNCSPTYVGNVLGGE